MADVRRNRYTHEEQVEYDSILATLHDPEAPGKQEAYSRLGALVYKADAYAPLPYELIEVNPIDNEGRDFHDILGVCQQMRRDGSLLELARRITCPVVAIHGDYDTRPVQGVEEPLSAVLRDFRMIVLKECGHAPWCERYARDEFYQVLTREVERFC